MESNTPRKRWLFPFHFLSSFFFTAQDFLFPSFCLVCGNYSPHSSTVCDSCWESLPRFSPDTALYFDIQRKLTLHHPIKNVVSCYIFEHNGLFQRIAHALKYEGYTSLGIRLGKELGTALRTTGIHVEAIVPVPLHIQKLRERGYNQAELLAHGIAEVLNISIETKLLRRCRYTKSQTKLNAVDRYRNMENAFSLSVSCPSSFSYKHLLLVDDVITTGATILACASELSRLPLRSLTVASAAVAQFTDTVQ